MMFSLSFISNLLSYTVVVNSKRFGVLFKHKAWYDLEKTRGGRFCRRLRLHRAVLHVCNDNHIFTATMK